MGTANGLPGGLTLRRAQATDQAAIVALVRANHLNPLDLQWRNFVVVTTARGGVVGIGQVKTHGDGSRELASIAVLPEWRRQGIARTIILALLRDNPPPLYLTCRTSLGPFYEAFGFTPIAVEQMPPYFRRIYRLAGLLMRAACSETRMLVMGRLG